MFRSLEEADVALAAFAGDDTDHRRHGEIGWLTPAERHDGTPFTDRGVAHVPALAQLQGWLADLRAAACTSLRNQMEPHLGLWTWVK
jgi:hypothetical protein